MFYMFYVPFMYALVPSYNLQLFDFRLAKKHLCNVKLTSATLFFKRQNWMIDKYDTFSIYFLWHFNFQIAYHAYQK